VSALNQLADHDGGTADIVDVLRCIFAAGPQISDQRRPGKNLPDIINRKCYAGFVCDGRQMQGGVGRTARRSNDRGAVLQRFPRHDVARQRPAAFQHFHHQPPGTSGNLRAFGIHTGHHRDVGNGQSHRLRHHPHGVRGELAGTGSDARQAGTFDPLERGAVDLTGHEAADSFVGVEYRQGPPVHTARQRTASIDEDGRHVATNHSHHHARKRFVASAVSDQRIIGEAMNDRFDRVGDQLA